MLTDDIMLWTEWFYNCLVPVAPEPLDDNLEGKKVLNDEVPARPS